MTSAELFHLYQQHCFMLALVVIPSVVALAGVGYLVLELVDRRHARRHRRGAFGRR